MKKVKAELITNENFAPFGQFYSMAEPKDYALCGELHKFFPDRLTACSNKAVGYSPIIVKKPAKTTSSMPSASKVSAKAFEYSSMLA